MKYLDKEIIKINNLDDFNIRQIFDCGQLFRYEIIDDYGIVISNDKLAIIEESEKDVNIFSNDKNYFWNYFDLDTDYTSIKNILKNDNNLKEACKFGYGIRILKQEILEMIVSFIISANNNIKRIKNSVNYISEKFGNLCEVGIGNIDIQKLQNSRLIKQKNGKIYYYAFPTLTQLKKISISEFVQAGLGYRAEQLYKTIQLLTEKDINNLKNLPRESQYSYLLNLSGVGEKVAGCIMLFALQDFSSFPVDTWINKVYNKLNNVCETNRKEIEKKLIKKYKNLSGYAQQYFFYYFRENKIK